MDVLMRTCDGSDGVVLAVVLQCAGDDAVYAND